MNEKSMLIKIVVIGMLVVFAISGCSLFTPPDEDDDSDNGITPVVLLFETFGEDSNFETLWTGRDVDYPEISNNQLVIESGGGDIYFHTVQEYEDFAIRVNFEMDIPAADPSTVINRFGINWHGEGWGLPGSLYGLWFTSGASQGLLLDSAICVTQVNLVEIEGAHMVWTPETDSTVAFDAIVAVENGENYRVIIKDGDDNIVADWTFTDEQDSPGEGPIGITASHLAGEVRINGIVIGNTLAAVEDVEL